MNKRQIESKMKERFEELQNMKLIIEECPSNSTEEQLYWKTVNGKTRYYLRRNKRDSNGKYLGNTNKEQLTKYAEKYRNKKYLTAIGKEMILLKKCLEILDKSDSENDAEKVWEELPEQIRNLTVPAPLTDEDYARKWQNKICYRRKVLDETPYKTMKGEYVRSKSECIIADRLSLRGIPYHYEINHTLEDKDGHEYTVQPDFTILNKRTRQEIVWEHLGKMGDEDYCMDNLQKLNDYVRSGYTPGRNLILSFESSKCPLSALYINTIIEKYLI